MSPFLSSTMRRFSRSSSMRKDSSNPLSPPSSFVHSSGYGSSPHGTGMSASNSTAVTSPSSAASSVHRAHHGHGSSAGGGGVGPVQNGVGNDSRPISSGTDTSHDYGSRAAMTHSAMPPVPSLPPTAVTRAVGNLSRTDQIVLKHFWEYKLHENSKRDLHYLKFPFFPQFPSHKDLLPYCEIYHLVKTSPGASIISLGSANGVYIGFELQSGSQLHIDMDDEWHNISHYRVQFKPYETMLRDSTTTDTLFRTWPKPLTIEYLEDQYQKWCLDLMSPCWEGREVRELGATTSSAAADGGATSAAGYVNGHGHSGEINGHSNGNGVAIPVSHEGKKPY